MSETSSSRPVIGSDLRGALVAMVRRRVPEAEVEDIVQATLAEAVESPHAPNESDALRRWLFGVAKHKVVDYHRRAGRESFDMPDVGEDPAPHSEADMLRWAERNLPDGSDAKKTLDWMIREGEGEHLESIAASEKVPAPRVRQRVSRMRRHFKDRWAREVALLAALGVIITAIVFYLKKKDQDVIVHDPHTVPIDPRGEAVRRIALEKCAASEWKTCIEGLDEAKRLDPAGDARPEVKRAREDAEKALTLPPPAPSSSVPEPAPTTSAIPKAVPKTFDTASPAPAPPPVEKPQPKTQKATPLGTKSSLENSSDFSQSDSQRLVPEGKPEGKKAAPTKPAPQPAAAPRKDSK